MKKTLLIAVAVLASALWSCEGQPGGEGKPYDQLPALEEQAVWDFFYALPASALPEGLKTIQEREAYKAQYEAYFTAWEEFRNADEYDEESPFFGWYMYGDIDGEEGGPERITYCLDWSHWSYNLDLVGEQETEYEYPMYGFTMNVYPGLKENTYYASTRINKMTEDDYIEEPFQYFWFDRSKGKVTPSKLLLNMPYSVEEATSDGLLTYGVDNLYYILQEPENAFDNFFYRKSMSVSMRGVGEFCSDYMWDGVRFVRDPNGPVEAIWSYCFGQIHLDDQKIPYDIHGYTTNYIGETNDGIRYDITRDGETSPTLSLYTYDGTISGIEVWSPRYCTYDDIRVGMPVKDLLDILRERIEDWQADWDEPVINDYDPDYVMILTGVDDNFFFFVKKDDNYLGNGNFRKGAVLHHIGIFNAVG